ncbi:MAG TPA: hypothetical protein VF794_22340 [Archangium sp.]|uniref:hypothetical protein n=1 Tax=Archangium sp. TaxID=1872627 RepID=UPI002EDAFC69
MTAIASILTSASGTALLALSSDTALPAVTCAPGMRGCATTQPRTEEPQNVSKDNHPCDWVETCQLPCGREGGDCCHAEWNCPPDANLPRC